jgi:hypothetical protein
MNKRIVELIENQNGHRGLIWTEEDKEEFAELLINECINVINKRYMGDNNREDFEVRRCVDDLKKHFGVE